VVLSILDFVTSAHCILQCWEKGIPLCKELAELYERRLFDYAKLSQILRTQAKFFDNILTQLRPEPEYFRVGFYGLSFPLFVRVRHIFIFFMD
jgi:dedicator of cytokinesis protein 3